MFSGRVPARLELNKVSQALATRRREGRPFLDLTISNPTRVGLAYPPDLLAPLADPCGLDYTPTPFGLTEARRAVAVDFARRGMDVPIERIALTASTSEAYSLLFKLLCDAGDEVLIPRPSYPLFDHLTRLDAVSAVPYDLEYHGQWSLDLGSVQRACTSRTRALLIVNPNNPTGSFVSVDELAQLAHLCATRGIAIISDEVFADYELSPGAAASAGRLAEQRDVLGFTLGGLSKSIGLPQAKLAWIAISGPDDRIDQARERLELVADTYLSVSTPVQIAAPALLRNGTTVREQIQRRITANFAMLGAAIDSVPSCRRLEADGGWSAIVQVPSLSNEEDLVLSLLADDDVLVHPGFFFDFPRESFLIVSLLGPSSELADAVGRVVRRFAHKAGAR